MGVFEHLKPVSMPIGGAIAQGIFVVVNASGQVAAAGDGADAVGVTLEAVTAAQYDSGNGQVTVPVALIQAGGKVPVRAAASTAIAVGDRVASGANGEVIPAAVGDAVLGVALEAAGSDADQEEITVLLDKAARLQT